MIRAASLLVFAACAATPRATEPHNVARAEVHDDACELIAAILAVPEYQPFYDGTQCGEPRPRPFVKIIAASHVVPPATSCPSSGFLLFHGERDVQGMVLVLEIGGAVTGGHGFMAGYEQPNPTVLPDGSSGGWNSVACVRPGTVTRENGRWVARAGRY